MTTPAYSQEQRAAAALSGRYEIDWRTSTRTAFDLEVSASKSCLEDVRDDLEDEADDLDLVPIEGQGAHGQSVLFVNPGDELLADLLQEGVEDPPDVIVEFEHRRSDPPREIGVGSVVTYPALDIDEEGATCSVCGYWGIVPARTDVLDAIARGTDRELVCATCGDEIGLEVTA